MRDLNIFAGAYLDRCVQRRKDPAWLLATLQSPLARFVPVWRDEHLVTRDDPPRAVFLAGRAARRAIEREEDVVFLGEFGDTPCFAIDVPYDHEPGFLNDRICFQGLRALATRLPSEEAGLLAYARALVLWQRNHRHCPRCGAPARAIEGGHVRLCTNGACGAQQFPRLDPAIIVLVARGDRCLLGRQPAWPEGAYSTIAGFVEPGESLEDAVRREVAEETGVRIGRARYHSSQPWPFPSSIMLGFTAEAESEDIHLIDSELEDARWFTREEIAERACSGLRALPAELSIAYRLVCDWYDDGEPGRLAKLLAAVRAG
jgi:NAD+ diphosphatase